MSYTRLVKETIGGILSVLYAFVVILGTIITTIFLIYFGLWYIGVPLIFSMIFTIPTISIVWEKILEWSDD